MRLIYWRLHRDGNLTNNECYHCPGLTAKRICKNEQHNLNEAFSRQIGAALARLWGSDMRCKSRAKRGFEGKVILLITTNSKFSRQA